MPYTRFESRAIGALVVAVLVLIVVLDACASRFGSRPAYIDDGSDYSQELDEYHERR